mmetsp:Transcript_11158/g.34183  ORF Transcript_11158/g.34183 Transcript_11158/m.34183 type:complete len:454 (+) Transcript_11158:45-1406(+)
MSSLRQSSLSNFVSVSENTDAWNESQPQCLSQKPVNNNESLMAALRRREMGRRLDLRRTEALREFTCIRGESREDTLPRPSEFIHGYSRGRHLYADVQSVEFDADGELMSIASSDGRIEVHDFEGVARKEESLRLRIDTGARRRISDCKYNTCKLNELIVGFKRDASLWISDLERCTVSAPTRSLPMQSDTEALEERDGMLLHGGYDGSVHLIDLRVPHGSIAAIHRRTKQERVLSLAFADCFSSAVACAMYHVDLGNILRLFDIRWTSASHSSVNRQQEFPLMRQDDKIHEVTFVRGSISKLVMLTGRRAISVVDASTLEQVQVSLEIPSAAELLSSAGMRNGRVSASYEIELAGNTREPFVLMPYRDEVFQRRCSIWQAGPRSYVIDNFFNGCRRLRACSLDNWAESIELSYREQEAAVTCLKCHPFRPYTVLGLSSNHVEVLVHEVWRPT